MTFGEKIYKLRKEKGLSQEALAEKLNTTRQAISKWENGQGFPETEKLLMLGNLFEVSVDYLLKDKVEPRNGHDEGYYVSKEMAEGYLLNERKTSNYIALGFSFIALAFIPYLVFDDPVIYTLLIIIIASLGIVSFVSAGLKEEDGYRILKKEALLFDQGYLKELTRRYENSKKKYAGIMGLGVFLLAGGAIPFLFEKKGITSGDLSAYFPVCVVLIAIGFYLFIRTVSILDAYSLLVKNEERTNRIGFKLLKKVKKRVDEL